MRGVRQRVLSARQRSLRDELDRRTSPTTLGAPVVLALTTTLNTYPASAQSYYACQPLTLLGQEVEGGPGVVTPGSGTFFALNLGSTVPPSGTQVVATFAGNRWVFRYDA
jgi:hypothetical protein